jgi:branched-chain amino acid aminotransferase
LIKNKRFRRKSMGNYNIKIEQVKESRISKVDLSAVAFGKEFSDHMFVMDYEDGAWKNPAIIPFQNISVNPAFLVLHYGQAIFEGMKAHKSANGDALLFRPDENFKRLNQSAKRLCIPQMDENLLLDGLKKLVELDNNWIPDIPGASMYIRPFVFATDEFIGVRPSTNYKLIIFTCPVNSYYDKAVSVKIETKFARASEGGTGSAKAAGNYAASLYPTKLANEEGYDQLIWTDAKEHKYIEESGTMNLMVVIDDVIVTPPAGDTILGGITRKSIIQIAKDLGYKVEERLLEVEEVVNAHKSGKLSDMFGTGTAVTITHIAKFGLDGTNYELPPSQDRKISNHIKSVLEKIKRGEEKDIHNWVVTVPKK